MANYIREAEDLNKAMSFSDILNGLEILAQSRIQYVSFVNGEDLSEINPTSYSDGTDNLSKEIYIISASLLKQLFEIVKRGTSKETGKWNLETLLNGIQSMVESRKDYKVFAEDYEKAQITLLPEMEQVRSYLLKDKEKITTVEWKESAYPNLRAYAFSESRLTSLTIPVQPTIGGIQKIPLTIGAYLIGNRATYENSYKKNTTLASVIFNTIPYVADENNTQVKVGDELAMGIPSGAFENCISLETFTIANPEPINYIGRRAFQFCEALRGFPFEDCKDLLVIDDEAFSSSNPVKIKDGKRILKFPSKLKKIGYAAFSFTDIDEIEFNDALEYIGDTAFFYVRGLKKVKLPENLTYLGNNAFMSIDTLEIFDASKCKKLASIPKRIFKGSDNLTTVNFSNDITKIEEEAFMESGIKNSFFGLESNEIQPESSENKNNNNITTEADEAGEGGIRLPAKLSELGDQVFYGCQNLRRVEFNGIGVVKIGKRAFYNCNNLQKIDFADTIIVSLEEYAFSKIGTKASDGVTQFGPLNQVQYLKEGCFQGAFLNIKTMDLSGLQTMENAVFQETKGINTIIFPTTGFTNIPGYAFYRSDLERTENLFQYSSELMYNIGEYAFSNSKITIDYASFILDSIGERAFSYCSNPIQLYISPTKNLKKIPRYCFYKTNPESKISEIGIDIEKRMIEEVEEYAFSEGPMMDEILLMHLKKIGQYAFANNSSRVWFQNNQQCEISRGAFQNCTGLLGFTFTEEVKISDNAFFGCTGLTNFTILKPLEISYNCFENCSGLKKAQIGSEGHPLQSMSSQVFANAFVFKDEEQGIYPILTIYFDSTKATMDSELNIPVANEGEVFELMDQYPWNVRGDVDIQFIGTIPE